jgi:hypothetical protein
LKKPFKLEEENLARHWKLKHSGSSKLRQKGKTKVKYRMSEFTFIIARKQIVINLLSMGRVETGKV